MHKPPHTSNIHPSRDVCAEPCHAWHTSYPSSTDLMADFRDSLLGLFEN